MRWNSVEQVLQKQVPFIGAYCGGEIGPRVRYGYVGWASPWLPTSNEGLQRDVSRTDSGPAQIERMSDKAYESNKEVLGNDPCKAQGWTSMYAACG
jgi:hypothetical protein